MVTPADAIAPGSTEYGDRAPLEAGLQQVLSGGPNPSRPTGPLPGPEGGQSASPLQALTGGLHQSDLPVTSGLSVGPGRTPFQQATGLPISTMQKLQTVALQAKSPQLRNMARFALRRIARSGNDS